MTKSTFEREMEDPEFAKEVKRALHKFEKQERKIYFARMQKEMKRVTKKYSRDLPND